MSAERCVCSTTNGAILAYESIGKHRKRNDLQNALGLRRADLDPELMAYALAVQHCRLFAPGGIGAYLLLEEEALSPQHLDAFLVRAVETAHMTRCFEQEWCQRPQLIPQIQAT